MLAACDSLHKAKPVNISWKEGQTTAVARLGYYDSFSSFEASDSYADLCKSFPWISSALISNQEDASGPLYLIVYRDGAASKLLFGKDALPHGDEVVDISLSTPEPAWSYDRSEYDAFNIDAEISDGCPYLDIHYEDLISSYTEEIKLPEGKVRVDGLDGLAKGVFIDDIGQDLNPVLCVLMTDGKVKICSILEAIKSGRCTLSQNLEGTGDVKGFVSDGGGEYDYEGQKMYEYTTIYAIDSRGKRHEIPLFIASNHYYSMQDSGEKIDAYFAPDWHMTVSWISDSGKMLQSYSGTFSQRGSIDDVLCLDYIVEGNGLYEKGTAEISCLDDSSDYSVKVSGILEMPQGTVFRSGYGPEMISDYGGEYEEAYQ